MCLIEQKALKTLPDDHFARTPQSTGDNIGLGAPSRRQHRSWPVDSRARLCAAGNFRLPSVGKHTEHLDGSQSRTIVSHANFVATASLRSCNMDRAKSLVGTSDETDTDGHCVSHFENVMVPAQNSRMTSVTTGCGPDPHRFMDTEFSSRTGAFPKVLLHRGHMRQDRGVGFNRLWEALSRSQAFACWGEILFEGESLRVENERLLAYLSFCPQHAVVGDDFGFREAVALAGKGSTQGTQGCYRSVRECIV